MSCLISLQNRDSNSNLSLGTGHGSVPWGVWVSSPNVLLQQVGCCCMCQEAFLSWGSPSSCGQATGKVPMAEKVGKGLGAGSYLLSPPAWAGEFPSQWTARLQSLKQRGGSPTGAVRFIKMGSLHYFEMLPLQIVLEHYKYVCNVYLMIDFIVTTHVGNIVNVML